MRKLLERLIVILICLEIILSSHPKIGHGLNLYFSALYSNSNIHETTSTGIAQITAKRGRGVSIIHYSPNLFFVIHPANFYSHLSMLIQKHAPFE